MKPFNMWVEDKCLSGTGVFIIDWVASHLCTLDTTSHTGNDVYQFPAI